MGCAGTKYQAANETEVKLVGNNFLLKQSLAIVRHGDRLDHTAAWETYPAKADYPNDTPLTKEGMRHAKKAGEALKKTGVRWGIIVASPYLRCAQTASCIAQVLKLPIHFDLDIGEVFDEISMGCVCSGPQHRPPKVLEEELKKDFPDVEWIRDEQGKIKVEGQQPNFPEAFHAARIRYAYKVQQLTQAAASNLTSIVVVTHGDCVSGVVEMMKEDTQVGKVDYTAYAVATRQVKVLGKGTDTIVARDEPVYEEEEELWDLKLSGVRTSKIGYMTERMEKNKKGDTLKKMKAQDSANSQEFCKTPSYLLADNMTPFWGSLQEFCKSSSNQSGQCKIPARVEKVVIPWERNMFNLEQDEQSTLQSEDSDPDSLDSTLTSI